MAITILYTINDSRVSIRWKETYLTEALNRKTMFLPRGVHRGFRAEPSATPDILNLVVDPITEDSVVVMGGVGGGTPFAVTYRETSTLPLTLPGDDASYYVVLRSTFTSGTQTSVEVVLYPEAERAAIEADDGVIVCRVVAKSGGGLILNTQIYFQETDYSEKWTGTRKLRVYNRTIFDNISAFWSLANSTTGWTSIDIDTASPEIGGGAVQFASSSSSSAILSDRKFYRIAEDTRLFVVIRHKGIFAPSTNATIKLKYYDADSAPLVIRSSALPTSVSWVETIFEPISPSNAVSFIWELELDGITGDLWINSLDVYGFSDETLGKDILPKPAEDAVGRSAITTLQIQNEDYPTAIPFLMDTDASLGLYLRRASIELDVATSDIPNTFTIGTTASPLNVNMEGDLDINGDIIGVSGITASSGISCLSVTATSGGTALSCATGNINIGGSGTFGSGIVCANGIAVTSGLVDIAGDIDIDGNLDIDGDITLLGGIGGPRIISPSGPAGYSIFWETSVTAGQPKQRLISGGPNYATYLTNNAYYNSTGGYWTKDDLTKSATAVILESFGLRMALVDSATGTWTSWPDGVAISNASTATNPSVFGNIPRFEVGTEMFTALKARMRIQRYGTGRNLVWESNTIGSNILFRMYFAGEFLEYTYNAEWSGSSWSSDSAAENSWYVTPHNFAYVGAGDNSSSWTLWVTGSGIDTIINDIAYGDYIRRRWYVNSALYWYQKEGEFTDRLPNAAWGANTFTPDHMVKSWGVIDNDAGGTVLAGVGVVAITKGVAAFDTGDFYTDVEFSPSMAFGEDYAVVLTQTGDWEEIWNSVAPNYIYNYQLIYEKRTTVRFRVRAISVAGENMEHPGFAFIVLGKQLNT